MRVRYVSILHKLLNVLRHIKTFLDSHQTSLYDYLNIYNELFCSHSTNVQSEIDL